MKGFTMTELVTRLSELHDIKPDRSFRRQVALALRRGLDYGILLKTGREYRFDPEKSRSRCSCKKRSRRSSRRSKSKANNGKARPSVPRPTVPPPPSFTPKPRNLTNEPFRVIRHQRQK